MKRKRIMICGLLILFVSFQPMLGQAGDQPPAFPKNIKGEESFEILDSSYLVVVSKSSNDYGLQTINLTYGNTSLPIEIDETISLQLMTGPKNITIDFPDNATYLVADDFIMNCYWESYGYYSDTISEPVAIILELEEIDHEGEYDSCDIDIGGNVNGYLYGDYLDLLDTGTQFTLRDTREDPLWVRIIVVEPLASSVYFEINATATNSPRGMSFNMIVTPIAGLLILILIPAIVLYFAILRARRDKRDRPSRKSKK